jgi:hypothetical protein
LFVSEKKVVNKVYGATREEVIRGWRNCTVNITIIVTLSLRIILSINKPKKARWPMKHCSDEQFMYDFFPKNFRGEITCET